MIINPKKYQDKIPSDKKYIYQIVSNSNGIDVDRFDYLIRDIKMTGLNYGIEYERIMNHSYIQNNEIVYCGIQAKQLLINKIGKNKVNCVREGKDQYKRTLAECFVNDISLSRFLVREGYAFAYRKYSKKFIEDEKFAKNNNMGMWSMKFEYPWDWRKKN